MGDIPNSELKNQVPVLPAGITLQDVQAQLRKILAGETFQHSERLSRFLRFCVELTLEGEEARLREHQIGIHVFDRAESFDPRIDSIVRVEARRLRAKLDRYYEREGREDGVLIQFRKGSYVPTFRFRQRSILKLPQAGRFQPPRTWTGIAVLPFRASGGGPDAEFFAEGLTQEVITALTGIENVRVLARTSSFQYRESDLDVCRIGGELKVDAVVEGSVARAGESFRVSIRLAGVAEGIYLWAETYEREARDVLRAQEDLALKVAESALVHLPKRPTGQSALRQPATDAYCSYLKGQHCLAKLGAEDLAKALDYFSQAVSLDGQLAAAHAGLARCHAMLAYLGFADPRECHNKANEAASRALALDTKSQEIQTAAAICSLLINWDFAAAEDCLQRAARSDGGQAEARLWYGILLGCGGHVDEAVMELQQAYRVDPILVARHAALGWLHQLRGERADALRQYWDAIYLEPRAFLAYQALGWAYLDAGNPVQALPEFEKARALSGSAAILQGAIGCCQALAGRKAEAEKTLSDLTTHAERSYVSPVEFAVLHTGMGNHEQALAWLEQAVEHRAPALVWLKVAPVFSAMHQDPGFIRLLRTIGLTSGETNADSVRAG